MVKIRTVEQFDELVDEEIGWRKMEMSVVIKSVNNSRGLAQSSNLRSAVLVVYAHWEGWVKAVARLYVQYVNSQSVKLSELSDEFLGCALKTKMSSFEETSRASVHNDFASFIRNNMEDSARVSVDLVDTESNLSSSVFLEIVNRLGLSVFPDYITSKNFIDSNLVHTRNTIAHGEYLPVSREDVVELKERVLRLLEMFTDDVRNAVARSMYQRS